MIIQTNYQPDISILDWKTQRIEYAKKHAKNKKHLRAFLLDIRRYRGFAMFFPGGSSFTPCMNKFFKKLAAHRERSGYARIDPHEYKHLRPSPTIRGYLPDLNQLLVCKKSCNW